MSAVGSSRLGGSLALPNGLVHSGGRRLIGEWFTPRRGRGLWQVLLIGLVLSSPFVARACLPAMVDMTARRVHGLAPQTRNLLRGLKQPLELTMVVRHEARTAGDQQFTQVAAMFTDLAELLRHEHPPLKLTTVDPDRDAAGRELLKRFPEAAAPCVVVQVGPTGHAVLSLQDLVAVRHSGANIRSVDFLGEQALAGAMLRLTGARRPGVIYVTTGHGELRLDGNAADPRSLSILAGRFAEQGCPVKTFDLTSGPIPADATTLLVAGPRGPFTAAESQRLETWLLHGGKAIWLFDLVAEPSGIAPVPTGLESSLERFGLVLGADRIVTRGFTGPLNIASPGIPLTGDHPLLQSLPPTPVTLYECRSVRLHKSVRPTEGTVTPLLLSHPASRAWADGDLQVETPSPGGDHDLPGPVSMAAAVENRDHQPMLVVVGDAEFAANRQLSSPEGRSGYIFLQSALHWLGGRADLLGDIPPRRHEPYRLSGTSEQHRQLVWFPLVLLGAFAASGGVVSGLRMRG